MITRDWVDFDFADLKSKFKLWGCLRPYWPQKSHISSISFKYDISIAFFQLRLLIGHYALDLILLHRQDFLHIYLCHQDNFEVTASYWDCTEREMIVIYQGDFINEDYELKLTNTLLWLKNIISSHSMV